MGGIYVAWETVLFKCRAEGGNVAQANYALTTPLNECARADECTPTPTQL